MSGRQTVEDVLKAVFGTLDMSRLAPSERANGLNRLLRGIREAPDDAERLVVWMACLRAGDAPNPDGLFSDSQILARARGLAEAARSQ